MRVTLFVLFFPPSGYLGTTKHYKTRANTKKMRNRPCFTPHRPPLFDELIRLEGYLNHKGTKIKVFRVCFRAPFLPSREKLYTPPPLPHFWPERNFYGGGGGYILKPPRQEFFSPPLFYTPPTPRRVFSGVGVYKIWPLSSHPFSLIFTTTTSPRFTSRFTVCCDMLTYLVTRF